MIDPIPPRFKKIWDNWNIRGLMLFSLFLQTFLILFAPLRKRTGHKLIIMLLWSAYLLADWAANFAVGLISDSQRDTHDSQHNCTCDSQRRNSTRDPAENSDLLAFWPPFLLLHLGGPDTITAFSLEDNELWRRHALGLVFQVVAAVYVFLQSLPQTKLAIPTLLMFLAGVIKYLERTFALYFASLDIFRDSMLKEPDPGPNYAKLMDDIASKKEANLPITIMLKEEHSGENSETSPIPEREELNDVQVVHYSYHYFEIFKGLIVDLIFSFQERNESREFFHKLKAKDALRVIEVELNFIYEALYTKVQVVHSKIGYFMRFISFALVVASLSLFYFKVKKSGFDEINVVITYALFLGAIALDTVAFFMLIFSDWTFAVLYDPKNESKIKSCIAATIGWFLIFKRPRCYEHKKQGVSFHFLLRRWSGHVSQYNLIRFCLKGRPSNFDKVRDYVDRATEKITPGFIGNGVSQFLSFYGKVTHRINKVIDRSGFTDFMDKIRYVSHKPLTKELWEFIFTELKIKSEDAKGPEDAKKISSARGNWILENETTIKEFANKISSARGNSIHENETLIKDIAKKIMPYLNGVSYDESLLLWHIATELLYHTEEVTEGGVTRHNNNADSNKHREFSKLFSDYMLYLLVMHPNMMSVEAGIGKIRFRDTCAEAERLFTSKNLGPKQEKEACEEIVDVNIYVKPITVKGDRSKSVLFDASELALELNEMNEYKWELLSKIWVEMLSYAACNCIARTQAQQVSKGGELISFVWLLMAHFGIGRQFQINKGQGRTKLIVGK